MSKRARDIGSFVRLLKFTFEICNEASRLFTIERVHSGVF